MTNSPSTQPYLQPWIIKPSEFKLLNEIAERHGLKATIVEEKEGAIFIIGSAETEIGEGLIGVHATGNREVEPSERIDLTTEFHDAPRSEILGGNSAKERGSV